MLIEVLSDHPGRQLRQTEGVIEAHQRSAVAHASAVTVLRRQQAAARRWWQLGQLLADYQEVSELRAGAPVIDTGIYDRRAQQEAGVNAEDVMTYALGRLSDDWLLFRGYVNRRGEIDHLLVGPAGIWAIEVKGRAVRVYVQGDRWSFEKFDRYGNLRDQGALTDRKGRSWGRQVSDPAADLGVFLKSRGVHNTVRTAVAVIHDRASLGSFERSSVDVVSIGTEYLMNQINAQPATLNVHTRNKITALIRRDHAFHVHRRKERNR